MDIETILKIALGFLSTGIGVSLVVYAIKQFGKFAKKTDNKIDDVIYELIDDSIVAMLNVYEYEAEEVEAALEGIIEKLEATDKDTTDLEEIIKAKEEEVKKQ